MLFLVGLALAILQLYHHPVSGLHQELEASCFRPSARLFCTTFYSSFLGSCLRTVNAQTLVLMKDGDICYLPTKTECIPADTCQTDAKVNVI